MFYFQTLPPPWCPGRTRSMQNVDHSVLHHESGPLCTLYFFSFQSAQTKGVPIPTAWLFFYGPIPHSSVRASVSLMNLGSKKLNLSL